MNGPVILSLIGTDLSSEEKEILQHPLVGGVILFSRNYENISQLTHLCKAIRKTRMAPMLITVDQEGGRVQRFKEGFTKLPAFGEIGALYESDPFIAKELAQASGWVMATELLACGVDHSFSPVLDVDKKINTVIGDRAFHQHYNIVSSLAKSYIGGMKQAGMASTGKHFPGHGSVTVDSHRDLPIDERDYNIIKQTDLLTFIALIQSGIDALMAAHILFPKIDALPVGFSPVWLKRILREELHFKGLMISDDLNMEGAKFAGDYISRAKLALEAGCDMILICNNRPAAINIIDGLGNKYRVSDDKFKILMRKNSEDKKPTSKEAKIYYDRLLKYRNNHEQYC